MRVRGRDFAHGVLVAFSYDRNLIAQKMKRSKGVGKVNSWDCHNQQPLTSTHSLRNDQMA